MLDLETSDDWPYAYPENTSNHPQIPPRRHRDQLFPRDAYRLTFDQLLERTSEKSACQLMVDLLALAHDRGCEAELATILDAGLAADQLPDMAILRERFAPDPAMLPGSTVLLASLADHEVLLGDAPEDVA